MSDNFMNCQHCSKKIKSCSRFKHYKSAPCMVIQLQRENELLKEKIVRQSTTINNITNNDHSIKITNNHTTHTHTHTHITMKQLEDFGNEKHIEAFKALFDNYTKNIQLRGIPGFAEFLAAHNETKEGKFRFAATDTSRGNISHRINNAIIPDSSGKFILEIVGDVVEKKGTETFNKRWEEYVSEGGGSRCEKWHKHNANLDKLKNIQQHGEELSKKTCTKIPKLEKNKI